MKKKYINRRDFIKATAAALCANFIGCSKKTDKPNLLFIWTDEQRADTMSVYGNSKIHTPNLNKLASECIVFQNAYVSQPVCTPSRSTVMTGLYPHITTCTENNIPLPNKILCFPEIVNDPDYCTGYFGKWHLGDELFPQHGFEEWVSIEDIYWRYYSEGRDKNQKSDYCNFLKSLGCKPDTSRDDFSRGFAARLPIEHCKPKFLESRVCDFLKRHRKEPFILYINFLEPHMPFFGPLNDKYDPNYIDLPINFDDPLEEEEPLRYRHLQEHYRQKGYGGNNLKTEKGWRRLIANYWGLVTQVDLSVGEILNTLDNLGLSENTIVVYTSDHGDMMGSHRLLAKTVMYEESVKVPLLMRIPQNGRRQNIIKNSISHIDIVPTLLDLMNIKTDKIFQGQSLIPAIKGEKLKENNVYIEWNSEKQYSQYDKKIVPLLPNVKQEDIIRAYKSNLRTVISTERWKMSLADNDKNQLFNLNKDPFETTNLFYLDQYRDIIGKLTRKIIEWQERVDDLKVNVI